MESACSLERGPFLTHASMIQRPHKPSRATHHLLFSNIYNVSSSSSSSSSALSAKCANLSSQRHVVAHSDASLDLAAATLTLQASGPSFKKPIRRKVSSVGRCDCRVCNGVCTLGSCRFVCFSLVDTVKRRAVRLDKKQVSLEAISAMVFRYGGQPEVTAAEAFGGNQMSRHLFQLYELPLRGKVKRTPRGGYRHLCEASAQEDKGNTAPDDENSESASEQNPLPVPKKDSDTPGASSPESEPPESDWRSFRARLVVSEQQSSEGNETETLEGKPAANNDLGGTLAKRWAHPILAPETGCVLIATDKIDGQQSFERSVILLLSPGSTNPREGPYGLILNRPLSCRIKDIKPKDRTLVKFFGNCQVHHGGPLDEDMFLLLHGTEGVKGYREVIPGVYYGAASGLEEIMRGRRPLDYRFFFGYSGWSVDQLKKEIEQGLWCVAACSTDLITGHSAAGLWEEILLLMGGKYAELSKRPRRKHF